MIYGTNTDFCHHLVEELTKTMLEGGLLVEQGGHYVLERPLPPSRQYPLEFVSTGKTNSDLVHLAVRDGAAGTRIMDLHLPASALVVLILRGDDSIAPRGATVLEKGDMLLVLTGKPDIPAVRRIIQGVNADQ